jgi:hypothetical protein
MKRMLNDAVMGYCDILPQHLMGKTEKKPEKFQSEQVVSR